MFIDKTIFGATVEVKNAQQEELVKGFINNANSQVIMRASETSGGKRGGESRLLSELGAGTVSYTHLTLPTICSV
eukprot:11550663-Alexandrium_andersonii.AAC.1